MEAETSWLQGAHTVFHDLKEFLYKKFLANFMRVIGCLSVTSTLGNNDHAKRTQEDTSRFPNWLHILESAGVDDDALDEDDESQGPIQVGGQHSADFEALQLYQQQQKEVMEKRMNDLS